ncbi:MAG: DNA-processing protein DprA [Kineosporiaceae bacterium]
MSAGAQAAGAERLARAHLSRVVEPGDRALVPLLAEHGPVALATRLRAGAVPDRWAVRARCLEMPTARMVSLAAGRGIRVVVPEDPDWPAGLSDLDHVAGGVACLWVRGRTPPSADRGVAVVGSRDASPYGEATAGRLGADLASSGRTVVSGAALGIDGAAHRGALTGVGPAGTPASPGPPNAGAWVPTVAVLGCGLDRAYPSSHAGLLDRIVSAGGAVVAELPPGSSPYPWRFPARNRVIAALSRGVVVVEAGSRSGAVGTARAADDLSRLVMAVPGPAHAPRSAGCHELLRSGADLVTSVADVLSLVGPLTSEPPAPPVDRNGPPDGTVPAAAGSAVGTAPGPAGRVRRCLAAGRDRTLDEVAAMAGLDPADTRSALLDLEVAGLARRGVGGWRRAADTGAPRRAYNGPRAP